MMGHVSAIVPARNEEAVVGACVESLVQQTEIEEVLVVDDQSTDRTAEIVRGLGERWAKVRLLQTRALPAGWVGKNHAVFTGAREARGEWLLFTDADAVHGADSAAKALAIAAEQHAVMVSFSAEQVMKSWYEKGLIPYVYCRLAQKFTFDQVNDSESAAAAANGQFLMIRRDVYERLGGHAAVAGEVLEDVALAERVKNAGNRIWFGSGKGIVQVRMYRSFRAMWEGWQKNLFLLMGGTAESTGKELLRAGVPVAITVLGALVTWALANSMLAGAVVFAIGCAVMVLTSFVELRRNGFAGWLAIYGVAGRLLFAGVLRASYRSHQRGKLEWKGRAYPVGTPGASK